MEVLQVFVVSADTNGVFCSKEQWAATLEAKNHAEQLLIVSVVVDFGGKEAAGVEGDWVQAIIMLLGNNDPKCISRCIHVKDELSIPIRSPEDRMGSATVFQGQKGLFTVIRPFPCL
jgi:hypothetical protein